MARLKKQKTVKKYKTVKRYKKGGYWSWNPLNWFRSRPEEERYYEIELTTPKTTNQLLEQAKNISSKRSISQFASESYQSFLRSNKKMTKKILREATKAYDTGYEILEPSLKKAGRVTIVITTQLLKDVLLNPEAWEYLIRFISNTDDKEAAVGFAMIVIGAASAGTVKGVVREVADINLTDDQLDIVNSLSQKAAMKTSKKAIKAYEKKQAQKLQGGQRKNTSQKIRKWSKKKHKPKN